MNNEKSSAKSLLKFETIALILGFSVDIFTIASILLSLHIPDISKNLPNFITPWLAFGLWILAVYIYFGFLRSVWDKHQIEKGFSDKFGLFLADDLFFSFRYPALLFPALVALLSLIWIASTDSSGGLFIIIVFAFLIFGIPFLIYLNQYVTLEKSISNKGNRVSQEFKERVIKEWRFLSSQINQLLLKQPYVDYEDLATIATIWEVPQEYMDYVLIQFAIKNPKKTKFASLYSLETGYPVNGEEKVLINLDSIIDSQYYYQ